MTQTKTETFTLIDYEAYFSDGQFDAEMDLEANTYGLPEWVTTTKPEDRAYADGYRSMAEEDDERSARGWYANYERPVRGWREDFHADL